MIPLGLRLTLRGGREALVRLVLVAAAVGLGAGLLLAAVSGINAATAQNDASAWLWTGSAAEPAGPAAASTARLWWHVSGDMFRGQIVARADVAATGAAAPVPPGIPRDPGPGQYYASPALAALLRSTPADELADRYPGRLIGTIGDTALASPDSLVIVVGHAPAQLARTPGTAAVSAIATTPGDPRLGVRNPRGLQTVPPVRQAPAGSVDLVLSVVALAILAPVLIFIATATRLSAARREQRFAAMRLAGATRRQVSLIAAVESVVAAAGGAAAGFGLFFLLRVPLSGIGFTGQPFFPAQLSLSVPDILLVALGIPAAAAVAARLALRRVQISPLGVARRVTPQPPRAWRVVPLLAGVAELGFFAVHGPPSSVPGQVQAFFPGFLLVVIGLVIAGPWLTMTGARFLAGRARRPGALIAARRLADDPRAGFRAVSGLVLALFVTTVAVAVLTTTNAKVAVARGPAADASVLVDQVDQSADGAAGPPAPVLPATATVRLRGIGGVTGIVEVRASPGRTVRVFGATGPAGVVSCAQLAGAPVLGRCPAGAQAAAFPVSSLVDDASPILFARQSVRNVTWPAADVAARSLSAAGLDIIAVVTDGSPSAIERARTVLDNAYPVPDGPQTIGEFELIGSSSSLTSAYQQLADVVILTSLAIAGCTLATSIAAGLADRKRPFSMLRLAGARLATLRGVVVLESAVPLLAVAIVAIGAGFGASAIFASAQLRHPLVAPGAGYYLVTAGGLAASLAIIAATFPLLRLITGPEVARNE
jgi:hypothetical protein